MKKIVSILLILCFLFSSVLTAEGEQSNMTENILNQDIDEILEKPYTDTVPVGFSENLFALHSTGWGFDSSSVYRTGISTGYGMPVDITLDGSKVVSSDATYRPSNVQSQVSVPHQKELYENVAAVNSSSGSRTGYTVTEKKYINTNDVACSEIVIENTEGTDKTFTVTANAGLYALTAEDNGMYIVTAGKDFTADGSTLTKTVTVSPGQSVSVKLATAFAVTEEEAINNINAFFEDDSSYENHKQAFLGWFKENVPLFDCDNEKIVQTYYFRWLTYRNHIRLTPENEYIITEFLPNVSWSGKYNSISCPASHHYYEGRWIKNTEYLADYSDFWFSDGADPRLYSFPVADSYYANYLVNGNKEQLLSYLDDLIANYTARESRTYDVWLSEGKTNTWYYSVEDGLYYQTADRDGMEAGIGGDGFRTTLNSYMYSEAMSIAAIAELAGKNNIAEVYTQKANTLKENIINKLWNSEEGFFETIKPDTLKSVEVRELIGYIPWLYNIPEDSEQYTSAWKWLSDTNGFKATYGPTTAEQQDSAFMATNTGSCRWDGPSWPFATSQTLVAAANTLNNYTSSESLTVNDYWDTLISYTNSQYKDGYSWVAEDLDPYTGEWIVDHARSVHYNHSTYADLIITGLCGLRPEDSDDSVTVNPLVPKGELSYFMLENVSYRGKNLSISYDETGEKYGQGLNVYVDGELAVHSDTLDKVTVPLQSDWSFDETTGTLTVS